MILRGLSANRCFHSMLGSDLHVGDTAVNNTKHNLFPRGIFGRRQNTCMRVRACVRAMRSAVEKS